ncbi:hypothetical protein PLICRDRAFT_187130 [Plicaturopsis crispa FD-325 SS-3]|nr:hypothetical protein PLICRDRAFT_187130 [Plicaturopsis crispa FD-325 SS-3]
MPITTRASAPNTPARKTAPASPPKSTPRKLPHCRTCGKPMRGHPRSGQCQAQPAAGPDVADALEGLRIEARASTSRRRASTPVAAEAQSLASLSTDSSQIVRNLLVKGITRDTVDEAERADVTARWQERIATPSKRESKAAVRARMPGTLNTPDPSFWQSTQQTQQDEDETKTHHDRSTDTVARPRPLARSMSVEERQNFLEGLKDTAKAAPATVYSLAVDEIAATQQSAAKIGFHSRALKGEDGDGLLIIGCDEAAVCALFDRLKNPTKQGGAMRAVAGGAAMGAIGTWAGLAFS